MIYDATCLSGDSGGTSLCLSAEAALGDEPYCLSGVASLRVASSAARPA